ncbi:MAG: DarT ssDNA thymidine ADP-ribosyltransferase family protein, partial [Prevotellaceae bacterium]|nr:DarT ssDNA thymidine ADP-ribosyltransferase family protein [Prevotellaceae bacterium]
AISSEVLDLDGTIISDGNAASEYTRFFSPSDGIDQLDFVIIYGEWWTSDDPLEQAIKKRIKCAEILVPGSIPYNYIIGACVVDETAKQSLINQGFEKEIRIAPRVFFRKEG